MEKDRAMTDNRNVLPYDVRTERGFTIIRFNGTSLVSAAELEPIGRALNGLIDKSERPRLLLDLGNIQFVSSPAINLLLSMQMRVNAIAGASMAICSAGPKVMELFRLTRLDRVFRLEESVEKAIGA